MCIHFFTVHVFHLYIRVKSENKSNQSHYINYKLSIIFSYFSVVCFILMSCFLKKIQLSSVLHFHFKICGYGASRKTNKYESKAKSLPYVLLNPYY